MHVMLIIFQLVGGVQNAVVSHNGDPHDTPWFHVRHALLMPATCDCAWLLTMPIVATMRGHRSLALLDRSHHDPLEPCAPGEFRVSKAWVVCSCLCFVCIVATFCNTLRNLWLKLL